MDAVAPVDDQDAPPSLEQLERELAANNAKLRELGVALSIEQQARETGPAGTAVSKSKEAGGGDRKATGSVAPAPGGKATSKPSKSDKSEAEKKQPRRDKPADKSGAQPEGEPKDEATLDWEDDGVRPDEAKAAPPSPSIDLDPEQRCEQVCDLAAISCGLGDQICELADRHPDETNYASACERANVDCEVAKEACDACAE
jgi:hypothetical protein